MSAIIYQRFPNIFERYSNLSLVNISRRKAQTVFTYLFYDNLATGGSLTGATLSCHDER